MTWTNLTGTWVYQHLYDVTAPDAEQDGMHAPMIQRSYILFMKFCGQVPKSQSASTNWKYVRVVIKRTPPRHNVLFAAGTLNDGIPKLIQMFGMLRISNPNSVSYFVAK